VEKTEIFFRWHLIKADPDDNKFVDCAISARVTFLVSNDKHFNELKEVEFPPVEVIDADGFMEELKKLK
jgi:predicted nucleic acid-binding protein